MEFRMDSMHIGTQAKQRQQDLFNMHNSSLRRSSFFTLLHLHLVIKQTLLFKERAYVA